MAFRNPILGGNVLLRPAIQSPNYASGSTGWAIRVDGTAEFNAATIRGAITEQGAFLLYNGTPASGNLVGSLAPAAGTDQFGNAYAAGLNLGHQSAAHLAVDLSGNLVITDASGTVQETFTSSTGAIVIGTAAKGRIQLLPASGQISIANTAGNSLITLDGPSQTITVKDNISGTYAQLNAGPGQVFFGSATSAFTAAGVQQSGTSASPDLNAFSGAQPTGTTALNNATNLALVPGQTTGQTPGTTRGYAVYGDNFAQQAVDVRLSGDVVGTDVSGNVLAWQDPTSLLGTGWARGPSSGTVQGLQYGRSPRARLELDGAVHTTSATPAATLLTLPSTGGYRPATTKRGPWAVVNSGGSPTVLWVEVNSNGGVTLHNNPAANGVDVYISASIPLSTTV